MPNLYQYEARRKLRSAVTAITTATRADTMIKRHMPKPGTPQTPPSKNSTNAPCDICGAKVGQPCKADCPNRTVQEAINGFVSPVVTQKLRDMRLTKEQYELIQDGMEQVPPGEQFLPGSGVPRNMIAINETPPKTLIYGTHPQQPNPGFQELKTTKAPHLFIVRNEP